MIYNIEEMLPHEKPMILIDNVVEINEEKKYIICDVTIKGDSIFYNKELGGISPLVGIEYMAQTIGCHAYFKNGKKKVEIGLLLVTRLFENNLKFFELGKTYTIKAQEVFFDGELVSYECFIYNNNTECAKATLNAFMPHNTQKFLEGLSGWVKEYLLPVQAEVSAEL